MGLARLTEALTAGTEASTGVDWSTVVLAVIGSSVLSSIISSLITTRSSNTRAREDRLVANLHAVLDCLANFQAAVRSHAATRPNYDPALDGARDKLTTAYSKCLIDDVVTLSEGYVDVADLYAAGDPNTSYQDERDAHAKVSERIRQALKRNSGRTKG